MNTKSKLSMIASILLAGLFVNIIMQSGGTVPPVIANGVKNIPFILILAYAIHHLLHAIHVVYVKYRMKKKQSGYDFCRHTFTMAAGVGPLIYYVSSKIEATSSILYVA